ncbi:DUF3541 domain-containing protein [Halomonas sp. GXIMD04776]|uniref:DUF3541 domain-containing protein n=1 Tax=Halomonas sp. GXIMD04776 TaxID=3415605 RepID=UPI003CA6030B
MRQTGRLQLGYIRALHSAAALMVVVLLTACASTGSSDAELNDQAIAEAIQTRYESELFTLSLSKQRHYTQRLYRITAQQRYVPINEAYAARLALTTQRDIAGLARSDYPSRRSQAIVDGYPARSEKQRRRKSMLGEWGDIAFAKNLLFKLDMANDYGLLDTPAFAGHQQALTYLKTVDFKAFLSDSAVIENYAAQVANMVYSLHQLGIADLRGEVLDAFRRHYPPERDPQLSQASFRNKIYGLTHFVIAASDYYQHSVSEAEYGWVLDYFAANIERILDETKADIYTEVGLGFQLLERRTDPALVRIKQALRRKYDPRARMIPAEDGGTGLSAGEHRNVLAIMLLRWPERLTPGPNLAAEPSFLFHQLQNFAKLGMLAVVQPFEHHHLAGDGPRTGTPRAFDGGGLVE